MDYFNQGRSYRTTRFDEHRSSSVVLLIGINVAVFIVVHLFRTFDWFFIFGLVPRFVLGRLMVWQFFTYMFLHVGLWHLVVNMLMLWFFGPALENAWGKRRFLLYYFFTGVGAGLCSMAAGMGQNIPVVGASGAVFGILVAYAMMYPEAMILFFFIFPMKMKYAILVLAGINLLGAISASGGGGIAYVAHLGGGLCGYLYLKSEWLKRKAAYFSEGSSAGLKKRRTAPSSACGNPDEQINRILDKISRQGINSLSDSERKILERKSKESQ